MEFDIYQIFLKLYLLVFRIDSLTAVRKVQAGKQLLEILWRHCCFEVVLPLIRNIKLIITNLTSPQISHLRKKIKSIEVEKK